jgi:hypothetical protein
MRSTATIAVQQIVAVEKKLSRIPHHVHVDGGSSCSMKWIDCAVHAREREGERETWRRQQRSGRGRRKGA